MPAGVTVTAFRDRSGLLNFYLVPGDLMMLQGVLTAAYFLYYGDVDFGIELVILGLSVALAGFGFWFASHAWRRLRDPEPPITIGPAGLHDRAISDLPIPWSDIGDLRVWDGKGGPSWCSILPRTARSTPASGARHTLRRFSAARSDTASTSAAWEPTRPSIA